MNHKDYISENAIKFEYEYEYELRDTRHETIFETRNRIFTDTFD